MNIYENILCFRAETKHTMSGFDTTQISLSFSRVVMYSTITKLAQPGLTKLPARAGTAS